MSVAEAAKFLGVSDRRVRQLIAAGILRAQMVSGAWIIGRSDANRVRDRKPGRPRKGANSEHPWVSRQDWGTPPELFQKLNEEFHFSIDAAADATNALLPRFFNLANNALDQSWQGERVFLNPPFLYTLRFVEKAVKEAEGDCLVVLILPVRSGNKVWQLHILPRASEIRYLPGRVTFVGASFYAPFDVAIVVFQPFLPPVQKPRE
jgi:phage N-6-adenine-methyltransferase